MRIDHRGAQLGVQHEVCGAIARLEAERRQRGAYERLATRRACRAVPIGIYRFSLGALRGTSGRSCCYYPASVNRGLLMRGARRHSVCRKCAERQFRWVSVCGKFSGAGKCWYGTLPERSSRGVCGQIPRYATEYAPSVFELANYLQVRLDE